MALGGEITDTALLRARVRGAELVIAADSGADRLTAIGLRPNVVIGDFDSLRPERVAALDASGVEIVAHPHPEARTDGQVALELAAARGAAELVLLGARGGNRLDHSLGNVLFLVAGEFAAMPITLVSGWSEAIGLFGRVQGYGRESIRFQGEAGDYVSLIPLSRQVLGVTTDGLRWPLDGADLSLGLPMATSNELLGTDGGFTIEDGVAIATHQFRQQRLPLG